MNKVITNCVCCVETYKEQNGETRETYFKTARDSLSEEVTFLLGLNDEVKVLSM